MKELDRLKAATSPEERAAAVARLEQLGESEPEAWNQLGIEYRLGKPTNAELAEAMFVKAAAAKNINGLMNVIGVRVSGNRRNEACEAAAVAPDWPQGAAAPAVGYLAECFKRGWNFPKDAAKAKKLLMESCRWGWEPACDSAMTILRSDSTPFGKMEYRKYLEKLSGAGYEPAMYWLATDLSNSADEADQGRSVELLEKASAAKNGPACTALALVLWGKGENVDAGRIEGLLDCGIADKRAPELGWLFKGIFAGFRGENEVAQAMLERSYAAGLKQAGAFSAAFGYPVLSDADPAYCKYFCDYLEVIKQARRIHQLQLDEQNRQAEIERVAREMAEREAMELAAQAAAQQAAYNAQIAAQNAEARKERRRRFWGGVLAVAVALATGYVQGQANAIANNNARPAPVYVPPSISAPYRPVYQQPASSAPVGRTQICYVQTPQGMQAITVNASQGCPVSLQSMGQPLRANGTGYLTSESVSGQIKICLYSGAAGQSSINISASGICPPSHQY